MKSKNKLPVNTPLNTELDNWLQKGVYFNYQGFKIFYRDEGKGPCLLLFHGYSYSGFDFKEILPALSLQYRVIIPDMPGMGFSDKPGNHRYSLEEMADVYTALLAELHIADVDIMSHDLGNSVVQELIARHQEGRITFSIRRIAFLNGGLFSAVYKPRPIQVLLSRSPRPVGRLLSKLMTRKMVVKATSAVFGENTRPSPALLNCFWQILNYNRGKSIAYLLGRLVFEKDKYQQRWISAMQRTKIPMCFINGPADPNSGIHMARRYRELIPEPDITLLPAGIGHWPQIEAPGEVLNAFFLFRSA